MYEPKLIEGRWAARAQGPPAREGRSRRRIGILSFSSPGHFYPLTALGRRLQSRGHEVVYFQVADLERPIRAAGPEFRQIGREDFPPAPSARGLLQPIVRRPPVAVVFPSRLFHLAPSQLSETVMFPTCPNATMMTFPSSLVNLISEERNWSR